MLRNDRWVAIAACLTFLSCRVGQAETAPAAAPTGRSGSEPAEDPFAQYSKLLDRLTAKDPQARADAWARVVQDSRTTISVLQRIADGGAFPSDKDDLQWKAIETLAELRARQARQLVVARLCARHPSIRFSALSPFTYYPAAQAIVEIGEPAIQELFGALGVGQRRSNEELKLIAYVFWHYYTPQEEQEVGLYRLKHRLKQMQTRRAESAKLTGRAIAPSLREENLARLIEIYQKINPNDPKDWPRPGLGDAPPEDESGVGVSLKNWVFRRIRG